MFQVDGEEGCKMTTASLSASNVFICDKVPHTVNKGYFLIQIAVSFQMNVFIYLQRDFPFIFV